MAMPIPIYVNVVGGLFDHVHTLLDQYVHTGYQALADTLRYPLALAATLYIVLLGYSISQGLVNLSWRTLIKTSIKIGVIYTGALNWDFFSTYIVQFIQEGSNQLGGVVFNASDPGIGQYTGHGIESALQNILIQFTKVGFWFWKRGGLYSITPYLEALVVWVSGVALVLVALYQLILADIMLSILFVAAPLFVSFALFPRTQGVFERWLGTIVGFGLLIFFVSIVLGFVLNITYWAVSGINESNLITLNVVSFVPIVVVVVIGIGLTKRVGALALDIGVSLSSWTLNQFVRKELGYEAY